MVPVETVSIGMISGSLSGAVEPAEYDGRARRRAMTMSSVAEIVRDLLIFIAVMTALLIAFVVIVSRMPEQNPLKRVLSALSYRLGATIAAGAVAIPLEPIPGIDMLYDFGVPIALIWYWYTFFRDARSLATNARPAPGQAQVEQEKTVPQEKQVTQEKQITHKDR
jgi:uncharacterized protein YggT (Ycf19 family)